MAATDIAEPVLQSMLTPKGFCVSSHLGKRAAAADVKVWMGSFVAPHPMRLLRVTYAVFTTTGGVIDELGLYTLSGSTYTLIGEAIQTLTNGTNAEQGSIRVLKPFAEYDTGTIFVAAMDFDSSAVLEGSSFNFFCQAVSGT